MRQKRSRPGPGLGRGSLISGRDGRLASIRKLLKKETSFFTSSILSPCLFKMCFRTNSGPWKKFKNLNFKNRNPTGRENAPVRHDQRILTLNFFPLSGHSHLSLPSSWVLAVTNFSTSSSGSFRPIFTASSSERVSFKLTNDDSLSSIIFCHCCTVAKKKRKEIILIHKRNKHGS